MATPVTWKVAEWKMKMDEEIKMRNVDRNNERVTVLACHPQEESKPRGKGTVSDERREEGIVGGGKQEEATEPRWKGRMRQ